MPPRMLPTVAALALLAAPLSAQTAWQIDGAHTNAQFAVRHLGLPVQDVRSQHIFELAPGAIDLCLSISQGCLCFGDRGGGG